MGRLATFWLRPDFVLRVLSRFQTIAALYPAMGLASSALAATVPITILIGAILPASDDAAGRMIARYDLSGPGAQAVRDAFQPASDVDAGIGVIGFFLLLFSLLSFTRALQRLFETTWELPSLSVRNTLGGIKWLGLFIVYMGLSGWIASLTDHGRGEVLAVLLLAPLMGLFFLWSGRVLSGYRIATRDLVPFAVVAAVLLGVYEIGASIYTPYAFNSYSVRYGVIGVVFALISALFGLMLVLVLATAIGREVRIELDNIRDGIRPSDDEVKKQWDIIWQGVHQQRRLAGEQWQSFRSRLSRSRNDGGTSA